MAPLNSQLFAGDDLLQRIADDVDQTRISRTQNRTAPAVVKVQQALLLWRPDTLPQFGADGEYGSESAAAVHSFKVDELQVPEAEVIDDVGPKTVQRLDEIAIANEQPAPVPAAPVVTSLDPTSGPVEGGTPVLITGEGFVDVAGVTFGATAAASFSVDAETQINAVTAAVDSGGEVDVVVSAGAGGSEASQASTFTFTVPVEAAQANEALVLADAAVADEALAGVENAILTTGAKMVAHLGPRALVVAADAAIHASLADVVGPSFTVLSEPPAEPPPGLDDTTNLHVRAWSLTARGPAAEAEGARADEGASFAPLGGCEA